MSTIAASLLAHPAVIELAGKSGESQKSGPLGFAVVLVLCVASYFLFKSMSKHLKRVREDFPEPGAPQVSTPQASTPQAATSQVKAPQPPVVTPSDDGTPTA